MSKVLIGTSGWYYDSWRGPFFPPELRKKDHLRFYAENFPTTELNGVFYRTPTLETVQGWFEQTPEDFVFAWKASKFITHWKRLTENCRNSIELMRTRFEVLRHKTGPVLFQLPPQFIANRERLASFLTLLPDKYRYAFEFRHPSWYENNIIDLLRDNDISLCLSDHKAAPSPWVVTARHVYVRGHGPRGDYADHYPPRTLRKWANDIAKWKKQRRDIYVYFDNDQKSAAPRDAQRLMEMVYSPSLPAAPKVRAGNP